MKEQNKTPAVSSEAVEAFILASSVAGGDTRACVQSGLTAAAPHMIGAQEANETAWCQPMDQGKHTARKFMIVFEDADNGNAVFDDETEAREFFDKANTNWNCYLFGTLPLYATPPAPSSADSGMLAALEEAEFWLKGALTCKTWVWDADQHEAASHSLAKIQTAIAAVAKPYNADVVLLTAEQVADHIGVTPYSDIRPFVVRAVEYAREKDALAAAEAATPAEGWALVPVEPTPEILDAVAEECKAAWGTRSVVKAVPSRSRAEWREIAKPFYRAMLSAAPKGGR